MKIDTSLTMPQLPETLSQAGLQFTVATEEDFDEIMAMSQDIYGGLDYLPTRYTSWLQEANRTVILARKQGKVVRLINDEWFFFGLFKLKVFSLAYIYLMHIMHAIHNIHEVNFVNFLYLWGQNICT